MSASKRPSGHVAFLFTDLEGSTRAWEQAPEQMNDALLAHDQIMRAAIADASGVVFSTAGDAFAAAFSTCREALEAAVTAQRRLHEATWSGGVTPKVRMGIHVGTAFERDENYFGPSVNRAARVMSCAHGGQVVISQEALAILGIEPPEVELVELGSHWLPDLPEPMAISQVVIGGLRRDFPPLDSLSPPPPRVPLYRTTFVGRQAELAMLESLIPSASLVTIVALGGTGKTRLAYKTATALAEDFSDGVFAIELADGGPDDVGVRASEAVLGEAPIALNENAGDPVVSLVTYLSDRQALLVIDNCEHVLDAARRLIRAITDGCPDVKIIATSREVLGLTGETVLPLGPLPHDNDQEVPPAVELYLERASAAKADLELDADEVSAVQETCKRLEGLPLAVELAAARVRTLTPSKILARLNDSLDVLKQRTAEGPDRHRSLEAAIWWSWNLLEPSDQLLLARMSVFVGGFGLEALEATDATDGDVLDGLESLVDKSLVASDGARYRLAEPIRQFAAARLDDAGALDQAHDAHLAYFYGLAKSAVPELDGAAEAAVLATLSRDHENLLTAIDRAKARGNIGSAVRLAARLHVYWEETGHLSVGLRVLESIVEHAPNDPNVFPALAIITSYASMCGDLRRGEELGELIRAAIDGGGLPQHIEGQLRFNLAFVEIAAGRMDNSIELWRVSGEQLTDSNPPFARNALWCSAYVATMAEHLDDAKELFSAAEAIPGAPAIWFPPMLDLMRGVVAILEGGDDVVTIERRMKELDDLGLRYRLLLSSVAAAHAVFHLGHNRLADRFWRRGLELAQEMGHLWGAWVLLEFGAWSAGERGDIESAAHVWSGADAFASSRGYGRWVSIERSGSARRERARSADPEHYAAGIASGKSLTLHDIVEAALGVAAADVDRVIA